MLIRHQTLYVGRMEGGRVGDNAVGSERKGQDHPHQVTSRAQGPLSSLSLTRNDQLLLHACGADKARTFATVSSGWKMATSNSPAMPGPNTLDATLTILLRVAVAPSEPELGP